MFHIRYSQKIYFSKLIHINKFILFNAYCSNEKKDDINIKKYLKKKEASISVTDKFKDKQPDETEPCTLDNENVEFLGTEKEKDATIRSRLSKECNKLSDKKLILTSSLLNFNVEKTDLKKSDFENYGINKTIHASKKQDIKSETSNKTISMSSSGSHSSLTNRPVRGEPGKVVHGFIPLEWIQFFVPKTGFTGFYTFFVTFTTFLVSKEYYVLEHNFYNGISVFLVVWAAIKYLGPHLAAYLDKEIDKEENELNQSRNAEKNNLNKQIEEEKFSQFQFEGQLMLIDAKRENVALQLEEEFRKRQIYVYEEVTKRLDYYVRVGMVYKNIQHKNLIEYVHREVLKSVTPELQEKIMGISIKNLLVELEKEENKK